MPSFIRKKSFQPGRRRYNLSLDSWYLNVATTKHEDNDEVLVSPAMRICYFPSYTFLTLGRPKTSRLEVEMQITYWVTHVPTTRVLHHVHILTAFQLLCHLESQGRVQYYDAVNPLSDDLPLIHYKPHIMQKLSGTTIVHFVMQRLYRTLTNIEINGKKISCLLLPDHICLGLNDLKHLAGVLSDQYCHLINSGEIQGISLKEFQRLLGCLYSVVLSGVNYQRYRFRLYQNSTVQVDCFVLRVFGCLSGETNASEARINQQERLQNFGTLHRIINPQVS